MAVNVAHLERLRELRGQQVFVSIRYTALSPSAVWYRGVLTFDQTGIPGFAIRSQDPNTAFRRITLNLHNYHESNYMQRTDPDGEDFSFNYRAAMSGMEGIVCELRITTWDPLAFMDNLPVPGVPG